jgi:hypothetical protein
MTTPLFTEAEAAWRTLDLGGGSDEFSLATVRLPLDAGYGPVRLAGTTSGQRVLLIPTESVRRFPESVSGDAVRVRLVQLVVAGRPSSFLEVSCDLAHLQAVFRALVDDVLRRLQEGAGPEKAVADAIEEFRALLKRRHVLSFDAQVGLFGELSLLNDLLLLNPNASKVWTGPLGQRYDFSGTSVCAEVKTTVQRDGRKVHISSVDQLQLPGEGRALVLVHTTIERAGAGGMAVRDLISQAMTRATDAAALERALAAQQLEGWRTDEMLASERFSIIRTTFYRVEGQFPRVSPESFREGQPPLGVSNIQYVLDLDHARRWQFDDAKIQALLSQLSGP